MDTSCDIIRPLSSLFGRENTIRHEEILVHDPMKTCLFLTDLSMNRISRVRIYTAAK